MSFDLLTKTETFELVLLAEEETKKSKEKYEQYLTPPLLARFMASLFDFDKEEIRILDPSSGTGNLFVAVVERILNNAKYVKSLHLVAYDIDKTMIEKTKNASLVCEEACKEAGVFFTYELHQEDFIETIIQDIQFRQKENQQEFDIVILNPPYGKVNTQSKYYKMLRALNCWSPNLYSIFLELSMLKLKRYGQLVSITPRSYFNGVYFKDFRLRYLEQLDLRHIHLFTSRTAQFLEDSVLQENVIVKAIKQTEKCNEITITVGDAYDDELLLKREVKREEVILPEDSDSFIRVVSDNIQKNIASEMSKLKTNLSDLGISVSTGKVVDFRAKSLLYKEKGNDLVALIQPFNIEKFSIKWPLKSAKKAQYIKIDSQSKSLLNENGYYVITKRFSSNEEKKRIVAALVEPSTYNTEYIAFENRINYFHSNGKPLDFRLAFGLTIYLNSSFVDDYFRQFSGHTQVNANDLRSLKYPTKQELLELSKSIDIRTLSQEKIDNVLQSSLTRLKVEKTSPEITRKIEEARSILRQLGFPKNFYSKRTPLPALTLLAILDLKPEQSWSEAKTRKIGIYQMIEFISSYYNITYAMNTRESVRKSYVHHFQEAALVVANSDNKTTPTNSGNFGYSIDELALNLIRSYGSSAWESKLKEYLKERPKLIEIYNRERHLHDIPIPVKQGVEVRISPGGQNDIVDAISRDFIPNFLSDGVVVYLGDSRKKELYKEKELLDRLNIKIEKDKKAPDLIMYQEGTNRIFVFEAVNSSGPIDGKRRRELERFFKDTNAEIVFITAFADKKTMRRYIDKISWETEVWIAEAPTHMIHLNGSKFLRKE